MKKQLNDMPDLGDVGVDVITRFRGRVVGRVEYVTGCRQFLLAGESKDGKPGESVWFDEDRVLVVEDEPIGFPIRENAWGGVARAGRGHGACEPAPLK